MRARVRVRVRVRVRASVRARVGEITSYDSTLHFAIRFWVKKGGRKHQENICFLSAESYEPGLNTCEKTIYISGASYAPSRPRTLT